MTIGPTLLLFRPQSNRRIDPRRAPRRHPTCARRHGQKHPDHAEVRPQVEPRHTEKHCDQRAARDGRPTQADRHTQSGKRHELCLSGANSHVDCACLLFDPIGQRLHVGPPDRPYYTVVGAVDDVKQASLAENNPEAVYLTPAPSSFKSRAMADARRVQSAVSISSCFRPVRVSV